MSRLKLALSCALLAALTGVAVQAILLLHAATGATRALTAAICAELAAMRPTLAAEVAAARQDLLARADGQIKALRQDVIAEIRQIHATADRRVGDTLARADIALG